MNWLSFCSGAACASLFLIGSFIGLCQWGETYSKDDVREEYLRERHERMRQRRKK